MRSSSIKKIKHTARQFHSRTLGRKQVVILLLSFTILFSLWLAYQYSIIPVGSNFLQPVSPEPSVIADSDAADAQPAKFRMCFTGDNILG
ncbi:hypothetical protein KC640_02285, partial [Candidatus Dojkabacteria bacterium]|nr:hypothetical protein [Candidatus Dojkabacteria bacterium]